MQLFEFDFIVSNKSSVDFVAVQDLTQRMKIDFEWNHMRMHHWVQHKYQIAWANMAPFNFLRHDKILMIV